MLDAIIVVFEGLVGVERRIDVDALNLTRELLFERLQREQVVAVNQSVVEDVVAAHAVRRVVRTLGLLDEDAWLQLRPVPLADPRQFELLLTIHLVIRAHCVTRRATAH